MRPEIRQLLQELLPNAVGGLSTVTDELAEHGGDAVFHKARQDLARSMATFILDNIVLNGDDKSAFSMEHDYAEEEWKLRSQVYVLTPQQLRTLLDRVFEAGAASTKKDSPVEDDIERLKREFRSRYPDVPEQWRYPKDSERREFLPDDKYWAEQYEATFNNQPILKLVK